MATSTVNSSNPYGFLNGAAGSSGNGKSSKLDPNSAQAIQNRFLTLLTAQLKAQDPSNPMDNNQITSQMSQISQVTGMQQLNQSMQSLLQAQMASQSLMATTVVGRTVLAPGNSLTAPAAGSTVTGNLSLPQDVTSVQVNILDKNGNTVDTLPLTQNKAGMISFTWDGKDLANNQLPAGTYTFTATATGLDASGKPIPVAATPYMSQKVNGVSWDTSGIPSLVLDSGRKVYLSDIAQLS